MKKGLLFAALGAAALGAFNCELYRYVFCREGSPLFSMLMTGKSHEQDYYEHRDSEAEKLRRLPQERFELRSTRGARLQGFYFPGGGNGKRIAFLVHGYRSEHAETAGMYYEYYRSRGFDLFCCDHEAHGESEGRFFGFATYEVEDCLHWLDFLRQHFGQDVQIVLHGFSMGAATVLRMAPDCPENVKFIVEDSGYRDAMTQLKGQIGPFLPPMWLAHRLITGIDLREGDTRPALRQTRLPILFVQGEEDRMVPFRNAPLLYESYEGEKDCLYVPGAKHVESMHVDPAAYEAKLDGMIRRYMD